VPVLAALFWISSGLLAWVYVGYPVAAWLANRIRPVRLAPSASIPDRVTVGIAAHNDPQQAIGVPNAQRLAQDSYVGMFSLGQGGYVTVDMGASAIDGPGADVRVYQTTSIEPVSLYASSSPQGPFTLIALRRGCGDRSPGLLSGHCDFDLLEGRVAEARYFKVEDGEIYPCLASGSASEGADIDAVEILNLKP
jgi:hypothetical protein